MRRRRRPHRHDGTGGDDARFSGAAQAAELTPIAEYVDQTVADTEAEIGGALDALGLEAE